MIEGTIGLVVGFVLLAIGLLVRKVAKRAGSMTDVPTYSRSVNQANVVSGIYTEHGMVNKKDRTGVHAQMKRSGSYYESFI